MDTISRLSYLVISNNMGYDVPMYRDVSRVASIMIAILSAQLDSLSIMKSRINGIATVSLVITMSITGLK